MILRRLLHNGHVVNEIDRTLRGQLLWVLFLRIVLYTCLLTISFFFNDTKLAIILLPEKHLLFFITAVYAITILSAFVLKFKHHNLRNFGFVQCLLDTFFVSVLVYYTGCSHSIFISVYFFPIISGGLILPKKGGIVSAAAATLQFGFLLLLEWVGNYPDYLRSYSFMGTNDIYAMINHFGVRGITFFLAALLSALFGSRLIRTEKALSDTQQSYDELNILYKLIFDNISTGIIILNAKSQITSVNAAAETITGYSQHELVTKSLASVFPDIDINTKKKRQAVDLIKKDGSVTRIGYSHAGFLPTTTIKNQPFDSHRVLTIQDISEIEDLERKYRQAEKLAAIGMMSASIAHDFRNPLAAISGSAQILRAEYVNSYQQDNTSYELADIIVRESKRLTDTITNFLRFARPEIANKEWFSLHSCIREVLQVFYASPDCPSTCTIIKDFEETLDIWADNKQIFIIFNELLRNAMAFCPVGRERIAIRAEETIEDDESGFVTITFEDNGPGIPPEHRDLILEPFYTNRTDGTGLGLAIVNQTIKEHQGQLTIASSDLGGAKFIIKLPLP